MGLMSDIKLRTYLTMVAGASVLPLVPALGCGDDGATNDDTDETGDGTCPSVVPEETAGPYPGDGSNKEDRKF